MLHQGLLFSLVTTPVLHCVSLKCDLNQNIHNFQAKSTLDSTFGESVGLSRTRVIIMIDMARILLAATRTWLEKPLTTWCTSLSVSMIIAMILEYRM